MYRYHNLIVLRKFGCRESKEKSTNKLVPLAVYWVSFVHRNLSELPPRTVRNCCDNGKKASNPPSNNAFLNSCFPSLVSYPTSKLVGKVLM